MPRPYADQTLLIHPLPGKTDNSQAESEKDIGGRFGYGDGNERGKLHAVVTLGTDCTLETLITNLTLRTLRAGAALRSVVSLEALSTDDTLRTL